MKPIDADLIQYEECLTKDGFKKVVTKESIEKMQRLDFIQENPLDTWDILFYERKKGKRKK